MGSGHSLVGLLYPKADAMEDAYVGHFVKQSIWKDSVEF